MYELRGYCGFQLYKSYGLLLAAENRSNINIELQFAKYARYLAEISR